MARRTRKEQWDDAVNLGASDIPEVVDDDYVSIGSGRAAGNPFIEVFGRVVLDVPSFKTTLTNALPLAPVNGVQLLANPVLLAIELSGLQEGAYPTPNLERLFGRIIEVLCLGYLPRNPLLQTEFARKLYLLQTMEPMALAKLVMSTPLGNAPSLLVIGGSGMGKTFGVRYTLGKLPKVVRHRSYKGAPMNHVQVLYLYVQCPPTGQLKALLLEILLQLDIVCGTRLHSQWLFKNASTDVLLINVAVILYTRGIGALVLDELQHLKARSFAESEVLMNFFVALMNFLNVPLICVGTYAAMNLLNTALRDGRRLCNSGTIDFEIYQRESRITRELQSYYFGFLPGQAHRPLTDEFHEERFNQYRGLHFLLPNMVQRCSIEASYRGLPYVTEDVFAYYRSVELKPIDKALRALASGRAEDIKAFDDLLSPEGIKALEAHQARQDAERRGEPSTPGRSVGATPSSGLGYEVEEFPHVKFTAEEVTHQCRVTRHMFGNGDRYVGLRENGLLAKDIVRGRLVP